MSLITACPACRTQFEVSDEQLQAYDGKVRCGECDHVFDAREHLVSTEILSNVSAQFLTSDAIAEHIHHNPLAITADLSLAEEGAIHLSEWLPKEVLNDTPEVPEFLRNVTLEDERMPAIVTSQENGLYFALVTVLLIGFIVQTVYFLRDDLSSHYPRIKPSLVSLCKKIHCEINLPHDLAQLTIDDADIQESREREGILVFSSVLTNHGTEAQAYPDIELTLTNTADEAVMRRIFKPAEYLHMTTNINNGLSKQQEITIKAYLAVESPVVAGFRVALGY